MRKGLVFYQDVLAGILTETEDGRYVFEYDADYIEKYPNQFISFAFPVKKTTYVRENNLFPFFDGLIPEGWLLDEAIDRYKIHSNDRMGLLLACCKNCIGAIGVIEITE